MEIRGRAEDAKAGAVVVCDDGRVVYIEKLSCWPDSLRKKRVVATGKLVEKKYIPDPQENPITQGAYGTQTLLEDASWRLEE